MDGRHEESKTENSEFSLNGVKLSHIHDNELYGFDIFQETIRNIYQAIENPLPESKLSSEYRLKIVEDNLILFKTTASSEIYSSLLNKALLSAANHSNLNIVRLLLEQKADPNDTDYETGQTPLDNAVLAFQDTERMIYSSIKGLHAVRSGLMTFQELQTSSLKVTAPDLLTLERDIQAQQNNQKNRIAIMKCLIENNAHVKETNKVQLEQCLKHKTYADKTPGLFGRLFTRKPKETPEATEKVVKKSSCSVM